jgi:hypothetical protein
MKDVTPWTVTPWDGQKISKPGIYSGIPMSAYHGDLCVGPSFSSTTLRKVTDGKTSMEEVYNGLYLNPDAEDEKDKAAWIRGRARHLLYLGEGGFREQFAIRPETYPNDPSKPWSGNSLDCKGWLAERALEGKAVLKAEELDHIHGAADKLHKHPVVEAGILNGLIEHSIIWQDAVTGLWLKARPDVIPTASRMIADYKGADDVSPEGTRKSISNFGYHQQLALVTEGLYQTEGVVMDDHVLVFQKWERPYSINIKPLIPEAIYRGRQQNRLAIDRLNACLMTDTWPGHDDDTVPAGLQDWLEKRLMRWEEEGILPPLGGLADEPRGFTAEAPEEVV